MLDSSVAKGASGYRNSQSLNQNLQDGKMTDRHL
jgi:hypothetical protein